VDGVGRPAGELLEHDRADQRTERAVGVAGPIADRAGRLDQPGEDRIDPCDLGDRSAEGDPWHGRQATASVLCTWNDVLYDVLSTQNGLDVEVEGDGDGDGDTVGHQSADLVGGEVAEPPQRAGLLEHAPVRVREVGDEPGGPVGVVVQERVALLLADGGP
jgi:hypothetical protein